MGRDYVVVCMRHKGIIKDALLFWGMHTEDADQRSFGGYTVDITKCERYTLEEVKNGKFKIHGIDFKGHIPKHIDDYAIKVDDLVELGYGEFTVMA